MYDELVKRMRDKAGAFDYDGRPDIACDYEQAADAIEELTAERDKYKRHSDSISRLPDCNTCGKKARGICEFMPAYGDWVRINCAFWAPVPPKEDT